MLEIVQVGAADAAGLDPHRDLAGSDGLRLAVLDANNEIVGIVALGDIATRQSVHTDEALREISTPDH